MPRAELQAWYLEQLRPKVIHAAATGVVPSGAASEFDRQLRDFLDLPSPRLEEAA